LDDARKNFHIWTAPKGDASQPISDNLIFTNKIYLYYENILNDEQINTLTNLYRSKGLEPVFRGFGYLEYRRLWIAASQEQTPVLPESVPLPMEAPVPFIDHSEQYIGGKKLPSLLSLFMTDFKGVGAVAGTWTDVTLRNGSQEVKQQVPIRVYNDIHNHVRFIALYVPPTAASFAIVKFLATSFLDQMNDLTKRVVAKDGQATDGAAQGYAANYPFSGAVYVYSDNTFSDDQMSELKKLYADQSAALEVRDFGYVIKTWNEIQSGGRAMPQEYKLTSGLPEPERRPKMTSYPARREREDSAWP
jgi:hypothetical protein